jgi:hypothetical protein
MIETDKATDFVTEADWIPSFWNFLIGLDHHDLIAELVQNDLDQQATRTVISFEQDHLVCEGNGHPVDADGWRRLRSIYGAGDSVPAKQGKIGVKNHGLKAAFRIGDEIQVLSDGRTITQTLYAHGPNDSPYPGASRDPTLSLDAPIDGCRVVINYRVKNLEPREGEAIVLRAVGTRDIDGLFQHACTSIPEQFAGIVSPEVAPRYEVVLRHWRLGDACFLFSCTRPRKVGKNMETFRRRCDVIGSIHSLPAGLEEEAARRLIPLRGRLKERVADFFRRGNRFFVEVSWPIDRRGKPQKGTGRFRYPIGYPQTSHESRTGHGVFFNAPVISDTERHGPARNDPTNEELRRECEGLLLDVMARRTVPKWGAYALDPLVPSFGSSNQDDAVRPLLAALAQRGAVPTMTWKNVLRFLVKAKRLKPGMPTSDADRLQVDRQPARYQFVAPIATWDSASIHSSLAVICPSFEKQLDPRIDPGIVCLLSDKQTPGFGEVFVTFDEDDAVSMATGEGNDYFAASENRKEQFAKPLLARAYLDVIKDALDKEELESKVEDELQASLLLPDMRSEAVPLHDLHSSAPLPSNIPGLRLPPLLHPDVASHPLFRRKKWRRPSFTMAKFLEGNTLEESDEKTRKQFWEWLRLNEGRIRPHERNTLADMAIWPDINKEFCKLAELCDPRSRSVTTVLRESLHIPHEQVRRSRIAVVGKKRRTSIRRVPSAPEVTNWLESRIAMFAIGEMADAGTAIALERFESDLAILLKDQGTARVLKALDGTLPALAQDGSIQLRTDVVLPDSAMKRLALPGRFILCRNQQSDVLQRLAPAMSEPKLGMLISAFQEDNENFAALQARLNQVLALTKPGDVDRLMVAGMGIVPVDNQPYAPSELAFIGPRGDYWGRWKTRVSAKGLSQDDQRRYLDIGVIPATPSVEASQAFFEWLSEQTPDVLQLHVGCALRHILHACGPGAWADVHTDIPFIPAMSRNGLRLVSLQTARHRPVYLPDLRKIADRVLDSDAGVFLVVDRVKEVTEPVSENLRRLGVRSLREEIREPEHVAGHGNIREAAEKLLETLENLRSGKSRRTLLKRLDELGVESDLVRHDWFDRISRIRVIRFAQSVEARYRFHRRKYSMAVDAGFDLNSGTFWIKEGPRDSLSSFCEALAAHLVFKSTARPVHLLALERALQLEIRDPSFGRPDQTIEHGEGGQEIDGADEEREIVDEDADPGEAVFGHSPFEPDPSRNVPKPGPIVSVSRAVLGRSGEQRTTSWQNKTSGSPDPTPILEKEHIDNLKTEHYASHCQMCLCERLPAELAPAGSYVEWEEVRRRIVEAHHVDPKSGGGARHAGNLILLCKLHHDNYGRRLTREVVTAALRETTNERIVRYGADSANLWDVKGRVINVVIPDTGEVVAIFFTNDHAGYWLLRERKRVTN